MNEYIQTNKRSLILLTLLFFILAVVLYFMLVRPLSADLTKQEKNIVTAKDNIQQLEETLQLLDLTPDDEAFEDLMLEKVIPKERELDEYILSLQQLEVTTESKIEQINFVYDSQIADHEQIEADEANDTQDETESSDEVDDEVTDDDEASDEEEAEEKDTSNEPTLEPTFIFEKPEGLQVISVRVTAASPSLEEFVNFLKAIEQSERLSIVSQLRFNHPTEHDEYFADEPQTDITFEIELTTFYYES
ncbi:MAG TPA: hypothetical protein VK056_02845 [Bacillota bacterium]|nr:hypothetical protein [Bacillota bacterium]